MKNFKLFCLGSLLLLLGSCSMNMTITKEEIREDTQEYSIDVTESFIDAKKSDDYRLIEPVNARTGEIIDSLIYDTKSKSISTSSRHRNSFKYELVTNDTVFIASDKIISVRITAYQFGGGAHGSTSFYGLNYSPATGRFLRLEDIFEMSASSAINTVIEKYFKNENDCFNEKPTIEGATVVNISKTSAIFTYKHYLLGAYACGSAVVEVPLKELNNYLKL